MQGMSWPMNLTDYVARASRYASFFSPPAHPGRSLRRSRRSCAPSTAPYRTAIAWTTSRHATAEIEPGAIVKGPAIIGPHCFVASGAYLRGGVWLEESCIIGPGSELKTSLMFAGTKLAHFNFVGDLIWAKASIWKPAASSPITATRWPTSASIATHEGVVDTGLDKAGRSSATGCGSVPMPSSHRAPS